LEQDLLADEKEIAEHLMLIDLGRNDVGRVSKIGKVQVTDRMVIERYSHVMHIVSNVQGEVRDDVDALMCLKQPFLLEHFQVHQKSALWKLLMK
jgi:anthranilate synthase component 1